MSLPADVPLFVSKTRLHGDFPINYLMMNLTNISAKIDKNNVQLSVWNIKKVCTVKLKRTTKQSFKWRKK